jgi:hypothetical protein
MWAPLKAHLRDEQIEVILDVVFHKELKDLDDGFLIDQIPGKIKLYCGPGVLIDNDTWTVHVSPLDYRRIRGHLEDNYPKVHSRQFQEMLGGRWQRGEQFTWVADLKTFRKGEGRVANEFVDELRFAAGAYWRCDATRATEIKARDIVGHLSSAVGQFPDTECAVVHTGIDTPDGTDVEHERFRRMLNSVPTFDPYGKDLRFIYCHLYESYSVPDSPWFFDESVIKFRANAEDNPEPLTQFYTVLPDEADPTPGLHWLREAPDPRLGT